MLFCVTYFQLRELGRTRRNQRSPEPFPLCLEAACGTGRFYLLCSDWAFCSEGPVCDYRLQIILVDTKYKTISYLYLTFLSLPTLDSSLGQTFSQCSPGSLPRTSFSTTRWQKNILQWQGRGRRGIPRTPPYIINLFTFRSQVSKASDYAMKIPRSLLYHIRHIDQYCFWRQQGCCMFQKIKIFGQILAVESLWQHWWKLPLLQTSRNLLKLPKSHVVL